MALHETAAEENAHQDAIESLVKETRLPEYLVRGVYERELQRLKPGARVKDFLVLFTMRRARDTLRSL